MALGDHYQVIVKQRYNAVKDLFNVYWYEQVLGTGNSTDLIGTFLFYVQTAVINIQCNIIDTAEIAAINVDNLADYASQTLTGTYPGGKASQSLPPFVTWTFRLNRTARGHHHGYKRYSGVGEQFQDAGIAVSISSEIAAVEAAVGAQLNPGSGNKWNPMIHRAANSVKPSYSNPEAFFDVGTCSYVGITSQNSRKY